MQVCFIGLRTIEKSDNLISALQETVITLINKGVTDFLFGSMSDFNDLAWEVVTELKKSYPYIKRVYVRSAFQYISKTYEEFLLKSYEETYFPSKLENAGKLSYLKRNYEMIDNSTFCVFYYDKNYLPPLKRVARNSLFSTRRNSGTKLAYEYAIKRKKRLINLCKHY